MPIILNFSIIFRFCLISPRVVSHFDWWFSVSFCFALGQISCLSSFFQFSFFVFLLFFPLPPLFFLNRLHLIFQPLTHSLTSAKANFLPTLQERNIKVGRALSTTWLRFMPSGFIQEFSWFGAWHTIPFRQGETSLFSSVKVIPISAIVTAGFGSWT